MMDQSIYALIFKMLKLGFDTSAEITFICKLI